MDHGARAPQFPPGGGEMGRAIREFDWSRTGLGPIVGWPVSLRTVISLLVAAAQPMFVAWGPGRVFFYNDAYAPLLGAKPGPFLGGDFFDAWPEIRVQLEALYLRVMAGEGVFYEDIALLVSRGRGIEEAHFSFSYTPLRDESGAIAGLFCACLETTGAVSAKRRQEAEKRRLARMFEQAPSFMALLAGPEHRFELANAAYQELVDYREIIGKTVAEALPEALAQGYVTLLDEVYASGKPFRTSAALFSAVRDGVICRRYLDFIYQPITDESGVVTGIFVEGTDVTDRIKGEEETRRLTETLEQQVEQRTAQVLSQEKLIRTFFDHSSECHAILMETEDGTFRYQEINPSTLALYGKTREQVIGFTTREVLGEEQAAALDVHLAACLRENLPFRYERAQGDAVVEAVATPIPTESGPRSLVVSARDVTERRRLEQQLRQAHKMEAVGQLTGGVAHDFNNILTSISGNLELLQMRLGDGRTEEFERYLATAQAGAKRAAALTHRLLAFSRQQTLDPRPTDINKLVCDLDDLVRRTMGPAIAVNFVPAEDLWLTIADRNQLENALLNLCINASDAMGEGGLLTIETANVFLEERTAADYEIAAGPYVALKVTDTGVGMSADVIGRAFDPFFTTSRWARERGLDFPWCTGSRGNRVDRRGFIPSWGGAPRFRFICHGILATHCRTTWSRRWTRSPGRARASACLWWTTRR